MKSLSHRKIIKKNKTEQKDQDIDEIVTNKLQVLLLEEAESLFN